MIKNKNCFILLELSPDLTDEKVIKMEIRKKHAVWSRDANISPNDELKRIAQQCLDNMAYINEIMLNPEKRKEEARKAKLEIQGMRDSKKVEFEEAVNLLSKGSVNEQAIKNLTARYKKYFYSEKDVREALSKFEVRSANAGQSKSNKTTGLDPSISKAIKANLKLLNFTSLYEFLGKDNSHSNGALLEAAKAIIAQIYKTPSVSTEGSIKNDLASHCLSIFADEEKRKSYDQSVADERLLPLYEMIDGVCDTGTIEIDHVLHLLDKAVQYNASISDILSVIRSKAASRSVIVNISETLTFQNRITCICKHNNQPLSGKCEKCSISLYYKCSKCHKALSIDSLKCNCGYSLESIYQDLKSALENGNKEAFLKLWEEGSYESHPAFQDFVKEYKLIKKEKDDKEKDEKSARERVSRLLAALKNNNRLEIFRNWDESLLLFKPDLIQFLPKIRKAHQPSDVKNVEGFQFGNYLLIRWELMEHVSQYKVVWSSGDFPKSPTGGESRNITRGEYDRVGFRLENPGDKDYYFKVYSVTSFRGEELVSEGTSESCQVKISGGSRIKIQYSIKFKGFFKKDTAIITLKAYQDINKSLEFVLIAKPGNIIPVDINSGKVIKTFPGVRLKSGIVYEQSFKLSGVPLPARFRLFILDHSEEKKFELVKDPSSKM